jgi:hypothetical protein
MCFHSLTWLWRFLAFRLEGVRDAVVQIIGDTGNREYRCHRLADACALRTPENWWIRQKTAQTAKDYDFLAFFVVIRALTLAAAPEDGSR